MSGFFAKYKKNAVSFAAGGLDIQLSVKRSTTGDWVDITVDGAAVKSIISLPTKQNDKEDVEQIVKFFKDIIELLEKDGYGE